MGEIIAENVNKLGGLDEGRIVPRRIASNEPGAAHQLGLFDGL